MVQVLPIHALHHFGLARPEGDGLDAALASEQVRERGAPGAPADHGDAGHPPARANAEGETRNAEQHGEVVPQVQLPLMFRVPTSAFRVCLVTPPRPSSYETGSPSPAASVRCCADASKRSA